MNRRAYPWVTPLTLAAALFFPGLDASVHAQAGQSSPPRPKPLEIRHPGFDRHTIQLVHEHAAFYVADMNGDRLGDLTVVEVDRTRRDSVSYVSVFLQSDSGFRRAGPPRALPAGVALAGAERFGGAPGLALLTPEGVSIWPWANGGFPPEPALPTPVRSVFPVYAGEAVQELSWIVDLDGDGSQEMIVPDFDGFTVLGTGEDRRPVPLGRLAVRPRTRFWRGFTGQTVAHEIPALFYFDLDRNGWKDVIAFGGDQLWVFPIDGQSRPGVIAPWLAQDLAPPKRFDPREPYDPPMQLIRAGDLNGDGLLDLVIAKNAPTDSEFNSKSVTRVFLGRTGGTPVAPFPETPDHVFPAEGFTLPIVLDPNRNGMLDLIQVNVEVNFWNAMRAVVTRTVKAEAAYYRMGGNGRYPVQPDELESYAVNFSLGRFGHQPIATWGDFNGDGLADLLLSSAKDQLGIHWGKADAIWPAKPDLTIQDQIPIHARRVHVTDLNADGRQDLVLTFIRDDQREMPETLGRLTVLISRHKPGKP